MKTCPNCGNRIADEAAFCNNCGTAVAAAPVQEAPQGAAPQGAAPQGTAPQGAAPQPQPQPMPFQQAQYQQPIAYVDPSDHTKEFDPADIADNKLVAVSAYFFSIIGIILCYLVNTPFTRFHAKNALRLSIASIIVCLLFIVPVLGWIAAGICLAILEVVEIICIVWTLQGKAKDAPIVSSIGFLK